ncbi:MAG: DUF2157 domain-containing protein [Verrucomicrobiae bacterium]|nr:DUF2157 domain-containing protein [Verrucomicrobiae bacterium]
MKTEDIEKIHAAGLITGEQRDQIIAYFGLKDEGGKFLVIISFVGAVLIAAGITLLISAHWDEIPRGLKIAIGLALMLGAHGGGWWLREVQGVYRKTGEALQFVGSALFLANIALVGQIYHLESRTPDAFLLWLVGIAALPWLLRSKAQLVLVLAAFCTWFGCEINQRDSLIYLGNESQVLAYSLLGLIFLGAGYWLRRTTFAEFASPFEKTGVFGLLFFAYPLTWAGFMSWGHDDTNICSWLLPALAAVGILSTASGIRNLPALNPQWRWTWGGALAAAAGLLCAAFFAPQERGYYWIAHMDGSNTVATIALFVFCLLQIQVGLQQRSRFLVNVGVTFIGLDMISAYFGLFGTMALTGAMFVVIGVFLILFGVFLEKKRRKFIRQIKTTIAETA